MDNNELFQYAVRAAEKSYSVYSGFSVGAALLTSEGKLYTGCNVENVSYSLTICAERNAVFKAVSEGDRKFSAIAVAGSSDGDFSRPCIPCGACLQVLSEFCGDDFVIVLADGAHTLSEYLPARFKLINTNSISTC
ncbi:MAG: cytidine deaminase [Oscillospiraceae bacterium]|nr:cytidine deaminase [Ruminococcus sp.]MDD6097167.1 cytidine deaminase [Oscillospiraceae bacterium]